MAESQLKQKGKKAPFLSGSEGGHTQPAAKLTRFHPKS